MAIERRVKPSARAKAELARRRKPILIGVAVVLVAVLVCGTIFGIVRWSRNRGVADNVDPTGQTGNSISGLSDSVDARQAVLADNAGYTGKWFTDSSSRFTAYVPGEVSVDASDYASEYVATNDGGTVAFGVMTCPIPFATLEGDPTVDTSSILSVFVQDFTSDAGKAMYDVKFSGAYDVSGFDMEDGSRGIWVTGDMQTVVDIQSENGQTANAQEMYFPICGFIAMREDCPVFVWAIANPNDTGSVNSLSDTMRSCAKIFASNKGVSYSPVEGDDTGSDIENGTAE